MNIDKWGNFQFKRSDQTDNWSVKSNAGAYILKVLNSGKVGLGTDTPQYRLDVNGDSITRGWLRTTGSTGWYNETHQGGWYMSDTIWLRSHNNKSVYTEGEFRTTRAFRRTAGYAGTSWNKGYGALSVEIADNAQQTPLVMAYRTGNAYDCEGAPRLFAMELLNSGADLRFAFGGAMRFQMLSNGDFHATGNMWSDKASSAKGQVSTSDERDKADIRAVALSLDTIINAPAVTFRWRDDMQGPRRAGTIAQYWLRHLKEVVYTRPDNDRYSVDYGALAHIEAHSLALCLSDTRDEVTRLRDKVERLNARVEALERENRELRKHLAA